MFKFLHAADIHLDSPLLGLERYEGAPVSRIRTATREALHNLVSLALSESVAFVLIAGDLFDGDWKDYNTGLFFARQMRRLRDASIPVFIVSGNHDAASQVSKSLKMPENVRLFSVKNPETAALDELDVAIHGQGFAKAAVTVDLASQYPQAVPGVFNIGLLHTSATGRPGHEPYAPCTLETLISKGYQYWALGHVHRREILSHQPMILFPGNIQGRHIREIGPKGCTIVTVSHGEVSSAESFDLDVLRWAILDVTLDDAPDAEDVLDRVAAALRLQSNRSQDQLLAFRLVLSGRCNGQLATAVQSESFLNEIRSMASDVASGEVWLETIQVHPRVQADLEELIVRNDPLGGLLRTIRDLMLDNDEIDSLLSELTDLRKRLPHELLHGEDPLDSELPARWPEILEDVKQIILARLLTGEP